MIFNNTSLFFQKVYFSQFAAITDLMMSQFIHFFCYCCVLFDLYNEQINKHTIILQDYFQTNEQINKHTIIFQDFFQTNEQIKKHKHFAGLFLDLVFLFTSQIDLSKMTEKLVNESMVQQRILNEVNIHCDRRLRHLNIVKVSK